MKAYEVMKNKKDEYLKKMQLYKGVDMEEYEKFSLLHAEIFMLMRECEEWTKND